MSDPEPEKQEVVETEKPSLAEAIANADNSTFETVESPRGSRATRKLSKVARFIGKLKHHSRSTSPRPSTAPDLTSRATSPAEIRSSPVPEKEKEEKEKEEEEETDKPMERGMTTHVQFSPTPISRTVAISPAASRPPAPLPTPLVQRSTTPTPTTSPRTSVPTPKSRSTTPSPLRSSTPDNSRTGSPGPFYRPPARPIRPNSPSTPRAVTPGPMAISPAPTSFFPSSPAAFYPPPAIMSPKKSVVKFTTAIPSNSISNRELDNSVDSVIPPGQEESAHLLSQIQELYGAIQDSQSMCHLGSINDYSVLFEAVKAYQQEMESGDSSKINVENIEQFIDSMRVYSSLFERINLTFSSVIAIDERDALRKLHTALTELYSFYQLLERFKINISDMSKITMPGTINEANNVIKGFHSNVDSTLDQIEIFLGTRVPVNSTERDLNALSENDRAAIENARRLIETLNVSKNTNRNVDSGNDRKYDFGLKSQRFRTSSKVLEYKFQQWNIGSYA